ncbi:MAG: alpha/beta fold hydrolase [Pseudomonadota bacterium]
MTSTAAKKGRLHSRPLTAEHIPLALRGMRLLFASVGRVLPGLMGRWAYRLWFRTRRYPDSAAGKRAVREALRETLQVDGIPVAIYSWGEGPVVLFIHGWSGRGSQVAGFLKPLMQAGYRVMAVDAPGHGETPGKRTNILECARVVQAFAQHYGPVHAVITHSFGGMVLAYAMRQGLEAGRVVCISVPARVEFLIERFAQTLTMPAAVVVKLKLRLEQRFAEDIWELLATDANAAQLGVPALIIHDEDDVGVPWQQGQLIADAWPGAQFLKTQGLGHGRILRDAGVVAQAVEFIKT